MHLYLYRFKAIKIFGFIGPSGSGKSFRSSFLIDKYNIDILIDDGLIIREQKIITGRTAKQANNIMDAVGTAIFESKADRTAARNALEKVKFKRVLIIGTSERMVCKICDALLLPYPKKVINIEDISTKDEIETAIEHRSKQGSHVVPVPTFEIRQSFPDMVATSLKILIKRGYGFFRKNQIYQKSIVRPVFSGKGTIQLSENALTQLVKNCTKNIEQKITINNVRYFPANDGYSIEVYIHVPPEGINLTKILPKMHTKIISSIQQFSGIMVRKIDIIIDSINDEN